MFGPVHIEALDGFSNEFLSAINSACLDSIPAPKVNKGKNKKVLVGFLDGVKHLKDTALFWNKIWEKL